MYPQMQKKVSFSTKHTQFYLQGKLEKHDVALIGISI